MLTIYIIPILIIIGYKAIESIPTIKTAAKPKAFWLEPIHRKLDFEYKGKYASTTVPQLHIHTILGVEI